ncbi:MAG: hypothetical protein ACLFRY_09440 [Spirochaetia bacterium]
MKAEEIIAEVWRQKSEMIKKGRQPGRVILSAADYRKIQEYHARLGELPKPDMDYIQKDSLFGTPIFIEEVETVTVE